LPITRREFVAGASAFVLAGGTLVSSLGEALAQSGASVTDLMQPGPLPELSLGKADAPVTIIEYASMTCPHCAHFHKTVYPILKEKYIDTGKVRFIFREFPLDDLAVAASMLARCAGGTGSNASSEKSLALIDVLFNAQDKWAVRQPIPPLLQIAKQAGMTQASFDECLKDQKLYNDILAIRQRGSDSFKVESTPTLFINGKMQKGGVSVEELEKLIQAQLKS
jgi:protein-disulfide isomerase